MTDVTRILSEIQQGDLQASEKLLPLVYEDLRRLAARELRREPTGHTLQPTALVHEAYLRLVTSTDDGKGEPQWSHRGHFYAAAALAMRRILVEAARRKQAIKRGGDRERLAVDLDQLPGADRQPDVLALDEALTRLAAERPELAQLVSLRYFAGLTMEQAAQALGMSLRTAQRSWTYARAWLLQSLDASE